LKRAFTLIELLVVIAIIAILAAILFPVFAQAKLQAKKISSLSNTKEVGLSELMYQNDSDDNFVVFNNVCNTTLTPALCVASGSGQNTSAGVGVADNWPYLLQPYIKNWGIMVDPGIGDTGGYILGANSTRGNQDNFVQFGYNYQFLSPFYQCDNALARNESVAIHPSSTVMFSTSKLFEPNPLIGFYAANPPGSWPVILPAPNACAYYTGAGPCSGYGNWSSQNPITVGYQGKVTSSSRASSPYNGGNVVWVDGHAKFGSDGYLATGTTYGTASCTPGAVINNINTYLWDLDGTLNDLSL
jgi:prepilin-type N-terminal cleavage/methylation domain-containing protein/prepilin-type processing-associated H-X9-DG protein